MTPRALRACRVAHPVLATPLRSKCLAIASVLAAATLALPAVSATAAEPEPAAQLDRTSVPAGGKQAAFLTVARFGCYAITVKSPQGMSLELVDRMAGPWPVQGAAGAEDGRVVALLDRGHYKLIARGTKRASGTAELTVHPFHEKNAQPPLLVELKPVTAALSDFEQISYWIEIKESRRVVLEAAGRHLTGLSLWKDGGWLVDAPATRHVVQPRVGKPLTLLQLNAELAPGLYLLTAYGGPSLPWAEDDGSRPFHLRFGIPRLGEVVRRRFAVSAFGTDRFLVPGKANYFRIELPEARPATLRVGAFDRREPFMDAGNVVGVTKQSVPPVAELLEEGQRNGDHVVTVSGEEGQPYLLQNFELRQEYRFGGQGDYWLSSVHSGHAEDSVDATALVVERSTSLGRSHVQPFADQVIDLDTTRGWARRANLLETLTVFLNVKTAGTYQVLADGTEAKLRIEPFLTFRPERYRAPEFKRSGSNWDLDAGFHVLTVEPVKKGIVRLAIRPKGLITAVLDAIGFDRAIAEHPVQGATRFERLALNPDKSYTVYLSVQPEVRTGLSLRRLPLDLSEPLFLLQRPAEDVVVPFHAEEPGTLSALAEEGTALELALDGGAWQKVATPTPGDHTVAVRHSQKGSVAYSLALEPLQLSLGAPLPRVPDTALASLPKFPSIAPDTPQFLDLSREASVTFALRAERPGLYRFESSGLLATDGHVRTRTVTSLASGSENGVGRNFAVQPYLGTGDYQLTVAARGESAGHLGLTLVRTDPVTGGFITSGVPARISLPSGTAVVYRFNITRPGTFRVHALALGRELRCRLEDADGWPIFTPGGAAEMTREFEPGRYRLIVLPETTPTRVVTRIDPVAQVRRYSGHGPHRLPLERSVEHIWIEPAGDQPRTPDAWEFTLPADVEATLTLTGDMQGTLERLTEDGGKALAAEVPPARGFRGRLTKGRYRLEAVAARRNNRAPYQISISVDALVTGLDRQVTAPAILPVAVGDTSLVEIGSYGATDVRARLLDSDGHVVAGNDDRPDDWNFAIVRTLPPGRYQLEVEPVGAASASSSVSMRTRAELAQPALAVPTSREIRVGRGASLYPLTLPAHAELLIATARAAESVGVAIESLDGTQWRPLGSAVGRAAALEIPLLSTANAADDATPPYRLRVWSLDRRDSPVTVSVLALTPVAVSETRAAKGVTLPTPSTRDQQTAVAITLDRPGLFRVPEDDASVHWCSAPLRPCEPARNGLVSATSRRLWAVAGAAQFVRAARLALTAGTATTVTLEPAGPITADVQSQRGGPLVVLATARAAQPGARLASGDTPPQPAGATMAVGTRAALTVALRPRQPAVHLWLASPEGDSADAKLAVFDFAAASPQPASAGVLDEALTAGVARSLALPAGTKRLRLALDKDIAAVLSRGDSIEAVFWAEEALAETTETAADRLTLLDLAADPRRFTLELVPMVGVTPVALALGSPFEQNATAAGVERLNVDASPGATLHVRGARATSLFVSARGLVTRGNDVPLDAQSGTLRIEHSVGPVLCWLDRPGSEMQDLWARASEAPAQTIDLPAIARLEGTAALLRFQLARPALIHVRSATPLVTLLRGAGEPTLAEAHPQGTAWDVFRPAGPTELLVRAFAGQSLSGTLQLMATPVTPIQEGLGPEALLAPGQARLFSFQATRRGTVGIGVRASSDVVETILMTDRGQPLGRGALQMPQLDAGTYLLALSAPPDAAPMTARAALAGLTPPDTGPPEDVVRGYLEPEQTRTAFSAPRSEPIDLSAQEDELQSSEGEVSEDEATSDEQSSAEEGPESEEPAAEPSEGGVQ